MPVESEGEKYFDIVHALTKDQLLVEFNKTDIIAAYRVGKMNPSGQNQRKNRLKPASHKIWSCPVSSIITKEDLHLQGFD